MTDIFTTIIYIVFGYVIARIILAMITNSAKKEQENLRQDLAKIVKEFIVVKPEKHGDIIYLFNVVNDEFVAQGKTVDELKNHCSKRFPNKSIVISEDYLKQFSELQSLKDS